MRIIDAQAYCKELILERDYPNRSEEFKSAIEVAIADLGDMPTIEAEPVKHGRWKLLTSGNGVCSVCHFTTVHVWDFDSSLNYCPHCGAKMDGDSNG